MAKTNTTATRPYRNAKTGEYAAVTFPGTGRVIITRADGRSSVVKRAHFSRPSSPWKGTRAAEAVALAAFIADPSEGIAGLTMVLEGAGVAARSLESATKTTVKLAAARA